MNEQRLKGLLGLSVRAGQAVFGEDTCRRLILSGRCGLLLLDETAGANTGKRFRELCRRTETPCAFLPQDLILLATGKDNMVMALKEGTFADQAADLVLTDSETDTERH